MFVYLVHHADAVSPDVDHIRPLSALGQAQAADVAEFARARGAKPALIWHSGKMRARQTAEVCLRTLNPFATFTACRGLQPDDDPDTIAVALAAQTVDVLIAGHMPHLPGLLHRLTSGLNDGGTAPFPLHGCVTLERVGNRWEERWRGSPGA